MTEDEGFKNALGRKSMAANACMKADALAKLRRAYYDGTRLSRATSERASGSATEAKGGHQAHQE